MPTPDQLLREWIARQASEDGLAWLKEKCEALAQGAPERMLFTSFSAVTRYLNKEDLALTKEDLQRAAEAREGWSPVRWTVSQAARTLIALAPPPDDAAAYVERLEQIFAAADVGEAVALYQSLPLLPHPDRFVARAAEGIRSNMTSVFNAVAQHNPYPAEYFDDTAWNQMVLKAVFVGSSLHEIQGLDERANPKLARMLVDYAHERWSAGRAVVPELWRPVGPFAEDDFLLDALEKALREGTGEEQEAAALALSDSPAARAQDLLSEYPELRERIEEGRLSWPAADPVEMAVVSQNNVSP